MKVNNKTYINTWLARFNSEYNKHYELYSMNYTWYIVERDENGGIKRQLIYGTLKELVKAVELWTTMDFVLYNNEYMLYKCN